MREAGLVVARALAAMRDAVAPGVSTLDLDAIAREVLARGRRDIDLPRLRHRVTDRIPAVICASVNDRIVHGIPSSDEELARRRPDLDRLRRDRRGLARRRARSPSRSARCRPRLRRCPTPASASLWDGLAAVRAGARLGDVSHAVETSVRRAGQYGIVTGYGGHGIGSRMHMDPHILNYGPPGQGPAARSGHGARHRADDHARQSPTPASWTTAGRS